MKRRETAFQATTVHRSVVRSGNAASAAVAAPALTPLTETRLSPWQARKDLIHVFSRVRVAPWRSRGARERAHSPMMPS